MVIRQSLNRTPHGGDAVSTDECRPVTGSPITRGCFVALLALGLLFVLFFGFGTWFFVSHWRAEDASKSCGENLKALSKAMTMYLADSQGFFPPANAWCDKLAPYVSDQCVFVCPSAPGVRCGYAFSAKLGESRAEARQDQLTIELFESDRGWNAAGGPELLPDKPRHEIGDHYVFVGGTQHWVERKRDRDKKGRRRWTKEVRDPLVRW